jgi:hypothetical protein
MKFRMFVTTIIPNNKKHYGPQKTLIEPRLELRTLRVLSELEFVLANAMGENREDEL